MDLTRDALKHAFAHRHAARALADSPGLTAGLPISGWFYFTAAWSAGAVCCVFVPALGTPLSALPWIAGLYGVWHVDAEKTKMAAHNNYVRLWTEVATDARGLLELAEAGNIVEVHLEVLTARFNKLVVEEPTLSLVDYDVGREDAKRSLLWQRVDGPGVIITGLGNTVVGAGAGNIKGAGDGIIKGVAEDK